MSSLLKKNSAKTIASADIKTVSFAGFSSKEDISIMQESIEKAAKKLGLTTKGKPIKCGQKVEIQLIKLAKDAAQGK